jgi:hypothetical protein
MDVRLRLSDDGRHEVRVVADGDEASPRLRAAARLPDVIIVTAVAEVNVAVLGSGRKAAP